MAIDQEVIPDEDSVSRLVDFPHKFQQARGLIWQSVFEFPQGQHESVAWAKYAPPPDAVHAIGIAWEAFKQSKKPDMRYIGFLPFVVGTIRAITTVRGHGFSVTHAPEDSADYHTAVSLKPADNQTYRDLRPGDKNELKLALQRIAAPLVLRPAT